jgi:hypothetical protein
LEILALRESLGMLELQARQVEMEYQDPQDFQEQMDCQDMMENRA